MDLNIVYQMFMELSRNEQETFLSKIQNPIEEENLDFKNYQELILNHSKSNLQDRIECPYCHSIHVIKNGHKDGKQRFKCKHCNHTFTWTNNTIIYNSKKKLDVWNKYCECFMNKFSLRKCAYICKIDLHTAFNWRHKILDALQNMHSEIHLNGIIESDETYFKLSFKGARNLFKPNHRGSRNTKRGISNELVCLPCSVNYEGLSIGRITNLGKPNINDLKKLLNDNHIIKNSIFVTDSLNCYDSISDDLELTHVKIPSGKFTNGQFNIQKINSYHSELKRFVNRNFKGVATKYLNNYVVYHNFVNWAKGSFDTLLSTLKDFVYTTVCNTRGYKIVERFAVPV